MKIKLLKYWTQKFLGYLLNTPEFRNRTFKAFTLVRSQKVNVNASGLSKLYSPFVLRNVDIEDYTYIATNSTISNASIGKFCSIGPNFCCGMGIHPTTGISTSPMFYSTSKQNGITLIDKNSFVEEKRTIIKNDVFIGVNVTILDGVVIGNGAVIGAGSVVTKDVPDYAIVVGVPAKIIKYRFTEEEIKKLDAIKWWNFEFDKLKIVKQNLFDISNFFMDVEK